MKSLNMQILLVVLIFATSINVARSQQTLDAYVREGLENNAVLRQKHLSLKQAEHSLKIARSWFLPSVSLLADYTHGDGGRSISMPIGDLLNPVYASLNDLTEGNDFPHVDNVEQTFFPQNFYDARVRTSLPLLNSDLHVNKRISSQQLLIKGFEVEIYQRDLVLDIKRAYYSYLSALAAVDIYQSGLELVERNAEINASLLKNGKSLPANLLRAESEVERVKAELNSAATSVSNARKYFNFLLNKDLNSPILIEHDLPLLSSIDSVDLRGRAEVQMLETASEIQGSVVRLHQLSRLPKVSGFIDVGSQASDWRVNENSRYYLAGVQVSVPLFLGFRTNAEVKRSRLEAERSTIDVQQATRQLNIAIDMARENLGTAQQNFAAATHQLKASRSYFKLIERGFHEGINSQIEYIDARNQLTSSELQLNLRQYEMLTAAAQLERQSSSFNLAK